MRKMISPACLLILMILLLPVIAAGEGEQKVFMQGETDPFPESAELLTVRVAALQGGDSMLITLGEHSMFVDMGTNTSLKKLQEVIGAAGIDHVEYFFNSHPHDDHIGGFIPLVESGFPVGAVITFFDHELIDESVRQYQAIKTAEAHNIPVIDMVTENTVPFGSAEMTAYRIPEDRLHWVKGPNDRSAMLMIRYLDCSILLAADVEGRAQTMLTENYPDRLQADILKYPHHGADPVEVSFLKAVSPEFAIITNTPYGTEPAQFVLRAHGIDRICFAPWGVITLQTDGHKWIAGQELIPEMANQARAYMKDHPWLRVPFQIP